MTSMRVRNDSLFGPIITERRLAGGLKSSEFIADPIADFGWEGAVSAPIRNICLTDYRGPASNEVHEIDKDTLFDYMDQFSLPLNVYGLKEDILDHLGSDVAEFGEQMRHMRYQLRALIDHCRCYYVSCDVMAQGSLAAIYELLHRYDGH
jgi:hypothetical protein